MAYIPATNAPVQPIDYDAILNVTFVDGVAFSAFGLPDPLWEDTAASTLDTPYVRLEDEAAIGVPEPVTVILLLVGLVARWRK